MAIGEKICKFLCYGVSGGQSLRWLERWGPFRDGFAPKTKGKPVDAAIRSLDAGLAKAKDLSPENRLVRALSTRFAIASLANRSLRQRQRELDRQNGVVATGIPAILLVGGMMAGLVLTAAAVVTPLGAVLIGVAGVAAFCAVGCAEAAVEKSLKARRAATRNPAAEQKQEKLFVVRCKKQERLWNRAKSLAFQTIAAHGPEIAASPNFHYLKLRFNELCYEIEENFDRAARPKPPRASAPAPKTTRPGFIL